MFSVKLHDYTMDNHKRVDKHPFVNRIKTNKRAGELYIEFNKICLDTIQKNLKYIEHDTDLYKSLYKTIGEVNIFISKNLNILLDRCGKYPKEHSYMFYVGLLYGGSLLKKYLPDHSAFLTFNDDNKILISHFKNMLNEIDSETQIDFINIINQSYNIIYCIFNEFENSFKNKDF